VLPRWFPSCASSNRYRLRAQPFANHEYGQKDDERKEAVFRTTIVDDSASEMVSGTMKVEREDRLCLQRLAFGAHDVQEVREEKIGS
jgi:hypothetical protein